MDWIVVRGARQHNLKNLSLQIPRDRLVVITGVSGSGKSSLAFDTLFAEGQRRYVESLSAYARQFLNQVEKPDVDSIEGLSPAISIEQKSVSRNPRSTVGTVTEIHDYLRLLYASIGRPHCPECGKPIRPQTVQQMVDRILALPEGTRLTLYAPFVRGKKGEYRRQLQELAKKGFLRARVDGETIELTGDLPRLDKQKKHSIEIVVDRVVVKEGLRQRLADSLETALAVGSGLVIVAVAGMPEEILSQSYSCVDCGASLTEVTPRLFSFNSPYGACSVCTGLGTLRRIDEEKLIADPGASIDGGALAPWRNGTGSSWRLSMIRTLGRAMGFSPDTPWRDLPAGRARRGAARARRQGARVQDRRQALDLHLEGLVRRRGADARAALPRHRVAERARRDREVHVDPAVRRLRRATAAARGARRSRSPTAPSTSSPRCRSPTCGAWWRRSSSATRSARSPTRCCRRSATASASSTTSAWAISRSIVRRRACRAARASASVSPPRSGASSRACSTCSTSRRSVCISATTRACCRPSKACAISATRCWWSSTTRRPSAAPTG